MMAANVEDSGKSFLQCLCGVPPSDSPKHCSLLAASTQDLGKETTKDGLFMFEKKKKERYQVGEAEIYLGMRIKPISVL